LRIGSRELSSAKITEKGWQRDSWQLQQRIGLRVPELAVGSWQLQQRIGLRIPKMAVDSELTKVLHGRL
jgi:hypothetical protein